MRWENHPLLRILIPFIIGMIAADKTIGLLCDNISVLFTLLCCFAAVMYIHHRQNSRDSFISIFGGASMLFFLTLGMLLFTIKFDKTRDTSSLSTDKYLKGIVTAPPAKKTNTWAVEVEIDNKHVLAYIRCDEDSSIIKHANSGDTLRLRTHQFTPICPLDTPNEDSVFAGYRRYLFNNGISATCYVRDGDWQLSHLSQKHTNLLRLFHSWRKDMATTYRDAGFEGEERALIEALTTGDKSVLSKELKTDYSRAGISHILALSGFHLAVIFAMLNLVLFGHYTLYRWLWLKSAVIIICLWGFTLLAGAPPSLVRSAIMCSLMSASACFGRKALSINSMTLAAAIMLVANPLVLMDVGFQLSFISVIGICITAVPLYEHCSIKIIEDTPFTERNLRRIKYKAINYLISVIIVSAVCSIFTAPLVAYHFHTVPALGILTNLLVCMLSVIILYLAGMWWMLYWWEWMRNILTDILTLSAGMMNTVAEWVSSISWATFEWQPSVASMSLAYCIIGSATAYFYHHKAWCVKLFLVSVIGFALCGLFNL